MWYNADFVEIPSNEIEVCPENVAAFYAACDLDTQRSFTKNFGGYPRSDIAMIEEEQNQEVALHLAERLVQLNSPDTSSLDDTALLASHRSKYCQSPSEMVDFIGRQLDISDEKRLSNLEGEERQKALEEITQRRKELFDSLSSQERDEVNAFKRKKEIFDTLFKDVD